MDFLGLRIVHLKWNVSYSGHCSTCVTLPGGAAAEVSDGSAMFKFRLGLLDAGVALICRHRPWRSPLGRRCRLHDRATLNAVCTELRIARCRIEMIANRQTLL